MNRILVCPEPLAAEAGAEIFRNGGSAVDAAMAAAFAQTVVDPAMATIGGTGIMQVYHGPSGDYVVLDFMSYAGSAATPDMLAGVPATTMLTGYRSIAVPTFVRGVHTAFERFGSGRVTWAEIIEPAIRYAEGGFEVYPYMHKYWRADNPVQQSAIPFDGYRMLTISDACAEIFTVGSRVHEVGERLIQPDLARTLRQIADEGPDVFYTGDIAARMLDDFSRNGATVTAQDLAQCRAIQREPLRGSYRGLDVATDPPPNVGPLLVELLNILEQWDLQALGVNTPRYLNHLARAQYAVFQDRARFIADPAFEDVPIERMTAKAYAAEIARRIEAVVGEPPEPMQPSSGTTQVTAYDDEEGTAVSFTHSIGIGSGVVTPGLGFIHNNGLDAFDRRPGRPNSIAPGKRPVTGGGPTMLFQDGALRYVLGSPHGSWKVSSMAQTLPNLIDFGMDPVDAVSAPRVHCEFAPDELRVDTFFPPDLAGEMERLGYRIRPDQYGGRVCLIVIDPKSGRASGASDPRGDGGLVEL
jgi:gamma-glutamyltranspeptidase / glutathione hydrolase